MTTKYSKQYEHQVRVEIFLPQDCIDFFLKDPTKSAPKNIKKFLIGQWLKDRSPAVSADIPPLIRFLIADDSR